jgi:hypothetical protein
VTTPRGILPPTLCQGRIQPVTLCQCRIAAVDATPRPNHHRDRYTIPSPACCLGRRSFFLAIVSMVCARQVGSFFRHNILTRHIK